MEAVMNAWNPSWGEMPWKTFTSPVERFQVLPSFVIGEFVFIALSMVLLAHAVIQGRKHVFIWIASLVAGTANDAFFMALPIVDNFWQSQACIMLTPRMPLYIPCVYIVFMYSSAVASWRLHLPWWSQAAVAGILGEAIYSPYDITGAKFLWWTWHDTDAPIRERLLGAPVGSSSWVLTFSATFQFLLRQTIPLRKQESIPRYLLALLIIGTTCTPIMMAQMAFFHLITGDSQGLPTVRTLLGILVSYSLAQIVGDVMAKRSPKNRQENVLPVKSESARWDCIARGSLTIYYVYLFLNMVFVSPENHISTGVHQILGPCNEMALDLAGHERQVYLCKETQDEDFSFDCNLETANETNEWYTVCSKPHSNYGLFVAVTGALGFLGTIAFRFCFGGPPPPKPRKSKHQFSKYKRE